MEASRRLAARLHTITVLGKHFWTHNFSVSLLLDELGNVPQVTGLIFCKVRLLDGSFTEESPRWGGGVQLKYGVVSPTLVSKWAFSWICSLSSIPHVLSPEKNQREARTDCIRGEHPRFDERLKIYPQLQKYYYQVVCVTHRLEVLHNSVQWGKMFEFECQTAVNSLSGVLDDCMCRLSVRKVS